MKTSYECFIDPGHGWLKVLRSELKELGIEKDISSYSYVRGDHVYLEEDVDAGKFIRAKKEQHGVDIKMRTRYADNYSRIRNYNLYVPW